MIILGIETTCDETGVGIVRDGQQILANVVASSASMHQKFGGIVPEVAARDQVKVIVPTLKEAFRFAQGKHFKIDAIAVANGPGLIGSLLIGVETAKTISLVFNKPLISVNHLVAHVYTNWLTTVNRQPSFPLIALIVSGGHTDLILMTDHNKYRWLGGTLDDAAGEAFDKVARVLGLGYPGGPEVERLAQQTSNPKFQIPKVKFPRPMISKENFDFSFSGLKTAVVNTVNSSQLTVNTKAEIADEFQTAVIDVLVTKTLRAAKKYAVKSIVVGGGVSANSALRLRMSDIGRGNKFDVFFPPKNLSVDNGVMIAAAAYYKQQSNNPLKIFARPGLYF